MTRVGNQTNSLDPVAVNSRIFVGNLNTHIVSKEDVERLFKKYGKIIGISMHKGYAFVQFTDTYDARNAILGEDGRTVAGQILDVNMVSEPKPHQVITRKRLNFAPDPFSAVTQTPLLTAALPGLLPTVGGTPTSAAVAAVTHAALRQTLASASAAVSSSPVKRQRTDSSGAGQFCGGTGLGGGGGGGGRKKQSGGGVGGGGGGGAGVNLLNGLKSIQSKSTNALHIQPLIDSDILICGTCREVFPSLQKLVEHKRQRCRLRFTCRCQPSAITGDSPDCPAPVCAQCLYRCASWWQLVCHMESTHGLILYQHTTVTTQQQIQQQQQQQQQAIQQQQQQQQQLLNNNNNNINSNNNNELYSANESDDGDAASGACRGSRHEDQLSEEGSDLGSVMVQQPQKQLCASSNICTGGTQTLTERCNIVASTQSASNSVVNCSSNNSSNLLNNNLLNNVTNNSHQLLLNNNNNVHHSHVVDTLLEKQTSTSDAGSCEQVMDSLPQLELVELKNTELGES